MADKPKEPPVAVSTPGVSRSPKPSVVEEAIQEIRSNIQSMQDSGTLDRMRRNLTTEPASLSAVEEGERSLEKPAVSEGGPLPKTWREAVPYVVWGVLILGFGLEFVTALVHAEWLHAIVSSVGLVGLMAAALHWTRVKTWAARYLSPTWVAATFSLLFLAIILAPFVEQRRWPFSIVFHDPPTAEDIAKATAPIRAERDAAIRQRDQAIRERDDAKRETQTLREQQRAPASQEQSSSLSAEDIATKIGVWQSINQQMNDLAGILNQGYAMLDKWLPDAKSNRTDLINRATALEASVQKFRTGLDQLRSLYLKDTDIATALDAVHLPGGRVDASYSVFTSLPYSIVQFVQHLQNLSDPLPKDVEYEMVPYIGAFRRDLNAMRDWQSQVRQTAATQDAELSKMKAK